MKAVLVGLSLFAAPLDASMAQTGDTLRVALEDAAKRAVSVSPRVVIAEGSILAARGERAEAIWPFPSNPTVAFDRTRRRAPTGDVYDFGWNVSQQVELAGQSFLRRGAASRRVRAAEVRATDARRLSSLDARLIYLTLHLAERRAALADSNATFAERLADMGRQQLDAGEINLLEYNTVVLEAARARSQADRAAADRRVSSADLGRILALPPDSAVATVELPGFPDLELPLARTLSMALARRPDMQAAILEVEASGKALRATRRGALPNLEVALFTGQEEGTDDLLGFSLGFSVPLFQRRQADVGSAEFDRAAAQAVSAATDRLIRAQVTASGARYTRARAAERRFATDVLRAASENATLASRAFEEGEVSIAEVVVFRTTAVATQLEYLEVLADAYQSWFELAAALDARPEELLELLGAQ